MLILPLIVVGLELLGFVLPAAAVFAASAIAYALGEAVARVGSSRFEGTYKSRFGACAVYFILALAGTALFLNGATVAAFLFTSMCRHLWRIISEIVRADHRRGTGTYSACQFIAADGIVCSWAIACFLSEPATPPDMWAGLQAIWQPHVILVLQGFWLLLVIYQGKSVVTDSEILIRVRDRIG
jgi:hypothetical protein